MSHGVWKYQKKFLKTESCRQTVLLDRSILIGQKLVENAKIQTFQCNILSNFRTMWVISVFALFGQNRTLWTKIPRKNKCIESQYEKVFGPFCVKTRANWLLDVFSHLFFDDQSVCVWPWSHKDKMLFNFLQARLCWKHFFLRATTTTTVIPFTEKWLWQDNGGHDYCDAEIYEWGQMPHFVSVKHH